MATSELHHRPHFCVAHGCNDSRMSEQLLDCHYIHAAIHQPGSKRVPKLVPRNAFEPSFSACERASFGCECGPPGDASRYIREARIAFVGKVVFTNDDGSGKFIQKTLVRFKVEEAFKGLGAETHEVWVDPGSFTYCYAEYHVGARLPSIWLWRRSSTKDSPTVSVAPGESKRKPTPSGIDLKNPPKVLLRA